MLQALVDAAVPMRAWHRVSQAWTRWLLRTSNLVIEKPIAVTPGEVEAVEHMANTAPLEMVQGHALTATKLAVVRSYL